MRPRTLADLDLADHLDDVVGTALMARAAAMQVHRTEGPTARMQDLAALSIGAMALLEVEVTRRAAAGLAIALSRVPSGLSAIAPALALAGGEAQTYWWQELLDPRRPDVVTADWAVFTLVGQVVMGVGPPGSHDPAELREVIARDESQRVGRLGIPAYRWLRVADAGPGSDRAFAAGELLDQGNAEVKHAMRDSFHWHKLGAGLAPIEPELLLAGLILLQASPDFLPDLGEDRRVIRATLAVAAEMLGNRDDAERLGGDPADIVGLLADRWYGWLERNADGLPHW